MRLLNLNLDTLLQEHADQLPTQRRTCANRVVRGSLPQNSYGKNTCNTYVICRSPSGDKIIHCCVLGIHLVYLAMSHQFFPEKSQRLSRTRTCQDSQYKVCCCKPLKQQPQTYPHWSTTQLHPNTRNSSELCSKPLFINGSDHWSQKRDRRGSRS